MTWSEISFSLRNLPVRAFDSRAQGFSPPLARQRSSCPPPSPNLVRTHLIENHQALRDSAPCLSRAATLPKATKLELGRGAHLKTPSSANHTAAASQPTGRIAKAASWLHLSRVSPALLPPERPSHTHTPKPGFGGRGHGNTRKKRHLRRNEKTDEAKRKRTQTAVVLLGKLRAAVGAHAYRRTKNG